MNAFRLIGALLPLILFLLTMLLFRQSAWRSSVIALAAAVLSAVLLFGAGGELLFTETLKGIWNAAAVIAVIWPAVLLYEVTAEGGAFRAITGKLEELIPDPVLRVLWIGWAVSSFLQGVTGFGVPVSVVAPILISMGLEPVPAIMIALLGQSWGNTFGTLAAAWEALLQQVTIGADQAAGAAFWTSVFLFLLQFVIGFAICFLYGGKRALRRGTPAVILFSFVMGGGQLLLSRVHPALCAFLPSVVCLAAGLLMGRLPPYREKAQRIPASDGGKAAAEEGKEKPVPGFHQAFMPYYALIAVCVLVLMIRPVYELLDSKTVSFSFPQTATALGHVNEASEHYSPFHLFTNPGMFLIAAALFGAAFYRRNGFLRAESFRGVLLRTAEKAFPATVTVLVLTVLSRFMAASGMIGLIASWTASAAGNRYGFIAPFIGMLGTFITGSNVSSNILFGGFQELVAESLHLNAAVLLGAQTSGGAIGSMISPSKIILGTGTVGLKGRDGLILRKMLPVSAGICLLYGVLTFVFSGL